MVVVVVVVATSVAAAAVAWVVEVDPASHLTAVLLPLIFREQDRVMDMLKCICLYSHLRKFLYLLHVFLAQI